MRKSITCRKYRKWGIGKFDDVGKIEKMGKMGKIREIEKWDIGK